jgi:SAM-dependent methyltransferase
LGGSEDRPDAVAQERSKIRWRDATPDPNLTWGKEVSGEAFIAKAESYVEFRDKVVLEIGPGYGRLLRECLRRELPFSKYVAVDLSPNNIQFLRREFEQQHVVFVHADIETMTLEDRFDVVLSSLTLKHLFPSFERALQNVERHLNPGATLVFDLYEGNASEFSDLDSVTYSRWYSRDEVRDIVTRASLDLVAFDHVHHDSEHTRLLVVATKPR